MKPLPCPFCGSDDITTQEGTTFRWRSAVCCHCGAQSGEVRVDTLAKDHSAALEKAKGAAIEEWNRRAARCKT